MDVHPLPLDALDGKVGILGITGSGKTFTAIGLIEMLLAAGRRTIIIDPTGAYHGLRAAFPIPIFGGRYGDVEIEEEDGCDIARVIVEKRLSAIVDVSDLLKESHASARRFMAAFIGTMKNSPRAARYLVMDEADEFMPENANAASARLFGDLKWIVRRGRIEGWRMLMVTQRPQDIAKSVLTQCETLVIHQLTAPQDRKAVEEWIKGNAEPIQAKEVLNSLASLKTGEAWIWSPRCKILERVMIPANQSSDSGRTPDADSPETVQLMPVDVSELRKALRKPTTEPLPEHSAVAVARDARFVALEDEIEALKGVCAAKDARLKTTFDTIERIIKLLNDSAKQFAPEVRPSGEQEAIPALQAMPAIETEQVRQPPNPAAHAILELLDRVSPAKLTWTQAATMTGRKASGGNFNAARKWLRSCGGMIEEGNFIRSVRASPHAMSRENALEIWKSVLPNPSPKMIEALQSVVGPCTKEKLGELIGAVPRGGNFNSGIANLRRNGVIADFGNGAIFLTNPLPGEG